MTVKELKLELAKYPDHMGVFMAERKTEFAYGLVNSVKSKQINFKESPDDDEVLARDTVVVLDEE
jgi:hypothetical protein